MIQTDKEAKVTVERVKEEQARRWQEGKEAARRQHQRARQQEQARRAEEMQQQKARMQAQARLAKDARMLALFGGFCHLQDGARPLRDEAAEGEG